MVSTLDAGTKLQRHKGTKQKNRSALYLCPSVPLSLKVLASADSG